MSLDREIRNLCRIAREICWHKFVSTPLFRSPELSKLTGRSVWLKCEFLQVSGSFKFRGALAAVTRDALAGATKISVASTGNFAIASAMAAKSLGLNVTVFVPKSIDKPKLNALALWGGEIKLVDGNLSDAASAAAEFACRHAASFIPSYEDPMVIAACLGLVEDTLVQLASEHEGEVDIYVPVGGGSLLAGAILAQDGRTSLNVIGVEPQGYDDYARSVAARARMKNDGCENSVCDALVAKEPGELSFEITKAAGARFAQVSDAEVLSAQKLLFDLHSIHVETSSASTLAALLKDPMKKPAVLFLTGRN